MNDETLKALDKSIKHWKRLRDLNAEEIRHNHKANTIAIGVYGTAGETPFAEDCPLCDLFWYESNVYMSNCVGCPVSDHTGRVGCVGSPWGYAVDKWLNIAESIDMYCDIGEWQDAADDEIEFLELLKEKS